ncbi:MAG: 2Fe-2S iron-sulfur cluster-binding protein [Pseudomonadales bacterium]
MAKITFVQPDGSCQVIEAKEGESVMDCAVDNGVPGITAQCGGGCTCSTCHGYLEESWFDLSGPLDPDEKDILEFVPDRRSNSRLTCQVPMSDRLDGMIVHIPSSNVA